MNSTITTFLKWLLKYKSQWKKVKNLEGFMYFLILHKKNEGIEKMSRN